MQQQPASILSDHPEQERTLSFLSFSGDLLGAAMKQAAHHLSCSKKESRVSKSPITNYLSKCYEGSEYAFIYDFYQEKDIDILRVFIEALYTHLQPLLNQTATAEATKNSTASPEVLEKTEQAPLPAAYYSS